MCPWNSKWITLYKIITDADAENAILNTVASYIKVKEKKTVDELNITKSKAYLCKILDANLINGFLWAARCRSAAEASNPTWIKNMILKLLAKDCTNPRDSTLADGRALDYSNKFGLLYPMIGLIVNSAAVSGCIP